MFQPLLLWSSLTVPPVLPPIQNYGVTRHKVYILDPVPQPVLPRVKSPFSDRPETNDEFIHEQMEKIIYKLNFEDESE
jgi:hypothetical protein